MARNDFDNYYQEAVPVPSTQQVDQEQIAVYLAKVMGWMCLGLFTTLAFAYVMFRSGFVYTYATNSLAYYGIFAAQLVVVISFSAGLRKMSAATATVLFMLYSALTGVTFSILGYMFYLDSIVYVFGLTASMFLIMAVYGFATKRDITRFGSLLLFGLVGLIIASVVNVLLLRSSTVDLVLCCLGIVLFLGLIAYDTQKIKGYYLESLAQGHDEESQVVRKLAIFGAFELYLDFINIFLRLLRLLGKRRN